MDTLREAVEKEREEIARETEYVAKLAEVRGCNVVGHLTVCNHDICSGGTV